MLNETTRNTEMQIALAMTQALTQIPTSVVFEKDFIEGSVIITYWHEGGRVMGVESTVIFGTQPHPADILNAACRHFENLV